MIGDLQNLYYLSFAFETVLNQSWIRFEYFLEVNLILGGNQLVIKTGYFSLGKCCYFIVVI